VSGEATVLTDAKGRKLTLRNLTVLEQARLFKAAGSDAAMNQPYMNIVQAAVAVAMIDDVPYPMPRNEHTIEAAIGRLGDEGIAAVMAHQLASMRDMMRAAEEAVEAGEKAESPLPAPASSQSSSPSST
jgi:hypothetical protein